MRYGQQASVGELSDQSCPPVPAFSVLDLLVGNGQQPLVNQLLY